MLNDYSRFGSVTLMLDQLSWPTLQTRRKLSKLQTLQKVFCQQLALTVPLYYLPTTRSTRQYHPLHFILPYSSTTMVYQLLLKNDKRLEHATDRPHRSCKY